MISGGDHEHAEFSLGSQLIRCCVCLFSCAVAGEFCHRRVKLYHALLHYRYHLLLRLQVRLSRLLSLTVGCACEQKRVGQLKAQGLEVADVRRWCRFCSLLTASFVDQIADRILKDENLMTREFGILERLGDMVTAFISVFAMD